MFVDVHILTWLKLSRALCKLASIPVGGSLVILIEDSSIPYMYTSETVNHIMRSCTFIVQVYVTCGMMCDSGMGAGSADMYTR